MIAVKEAIPTSRARSALFSTFAETKAQARRKRSKSRGVATLASEVVLVQVGGGVFFPSLSAGGGGGGGAGLARYGVIEGKLVVGFACS